MQRLVTGGAGVPAARGGYGEVPVAHAECWGGAW